MFKNSFSWFRNKPELRINNVTLEVFFRRNSACLAPLSFRLLTLLADKSPEPVTFDEIEKAVWDAPVTRETLKQRIRLLRESLIGIGVPDNALLAIRSVGYKLTIPVNVDSLDPAKTRRKLVWAMLGLVIVGAIVLSKAMNLPLTNRAINPAMFTPSETRIAVLDHASTQKKSIHRLLTSQLSKLQNVETLSVRVDRDQQDINPTKLARDNSADMLITSTMITVNEQEMLSLQLVEGRTGVILFAQEYDYKAGQEVNSVAHFVKAVNHEIERTDVHLTQTLAQLPDFESQNNYLDAVTLSSVPTARNLSAAINLLDDVIGIQAGFDEGRILRARLIADSVIRYRQHVARLAQAVQDAKELYATQPNNAKYIYTLARAEVASGNYSAALDHLRYVENFMPYVKRDIQGLEKRLATQNALEN